MSGLPPGNRRRGGWCACCCMHGDLWIVADSNPRELVKGWSGVYHDQTPGRMMLVNASSWIVSPRYELEAQSYEA